MLLKEMRRREHHFFGTTFVWQRNHSWLGPQIWTWNRVVAIVLMVVSRDKNNVSPRQGDYALTPGLFPPSLWGNLIITSPQLSLACLLDSKGGSRVQPQVLHLYSLWGSNFWLLPKQEEHDAKLSWESKEISLSRIQGNIDCVLVAAYKAQKTVKF